MPWPVIDYHRLWARLVWTRRPAMVRRYAGLQRLTLSRRRLLWWEQTQWVWGVASFFNFQWYSKYPYPLLHLPQLQCERQCMLLWHLSRTVLSFCQSSILIYPMKYLQEQDLIKQFSHCCMCSPSFSLGLLTAMGRIGFDTSSHLRHNYWQSMVLCSLEVSDLVAQ
jgi:hypothetical protein